MKIEKCNISLEREFLRINFEGELIKNAFPRVFGKKENNKFITADNDNVKFKIKTPFENSLNSAYSKFVEISNVVVENLYKLNVCMWPLSRYCDGKEKIKLSAKMNFSIDEEFYKESGLTITLQEAYSKIEKEFDKKNWILKDFLGDCKVKSTRNGLQVYDIRLDYLSEHGISKDDLNLLMTFLFGCLDEDKSSNLTEEISYLVSIDEKYNLKAHESLENMAKLDSEGTKRFKNEDKLTSEEIKTLYKQYAEKGHDIRYCLQEHKKMLCETKILIKDAISQGIDYKVLNEVKNVVELSGNGKKEFVIEGNQTNRDSYIFPIITDDKFIAKHVMKDYGLNVPDAILLEKGMDLVDRESILQEYYGKPIVVKPRNTNFGTGITVFAEGATKEQLLNAVEYAFKFDENILIESYVKGMEYRFLVIDGKCLSVANRRIASVIGDGKSTIKELIDAKNQEPWHRDTGTPVKMEEPVVEYLKLQGYDYDTVLSSDKRVFLRTNSNCSTGGESIDMTEKMPKYFKKVSEQASKAFDAKVCGVDIIIEDLSKEEYSIIEINDDPGYSINEWPYEGEGEKVGIAILKLLDLIPTK